MNTQEFLILPPEEACKLLASDDLNIPNEEIIYQSLLMWINHDLATRKKYLPKLMSHIRLPLMSPQVRKWWCWLLPKIQYQVCHVVLGSVFCAAGMLSSVWSQHFHIVSLSLQFNQAQMTGVECVLVLVRYMCHVQSVTGQSSGCTLYVHAFECLEQGHYETMQRDFLTEKNENFRKFLIFLAHLSRRLTR